MAQETIVGSKPLQDTGARTWKDLDEDQRKLIRELEAKLLGIVEDANPAAGSKEDECKDDWGFAKWFPARTHRALMLNGPRGTGKTSLMLTALRLWQTGKSPDDDGYVKPGGRDDVPWRALRPLDFDPMPANLHAYAWLVMGLKRVVDAVVKEQHMRSQSADDDLARMWHDLYQDALVGWDGDVHRQMMTQDIEDYIYDSQKSGRGWQELPRAWRNFVSKLLEALESARKMPVGGVLVLPIDDLDLQPQRAHELLLAMRLCWHPRLVFLLTGHAAHLTKVVELHLGGVERVVAGCPTHSPTPFVAPLARDLVNKVIPPGNRVEMPLWTLRHVLKSKLIAGVDGLEGLAQMFAEREVRVAQVIKYLMSLQERRGFGFRIRDAVQTGALDWRGDPLKVLSDLFRQLHSDLGGPVYERGVHDQPGARNQLVTAIATHLPSAGAQIVRSADFVWYFENNPTIAHPADDHVVLAAQLAAQNALTAEIAWDGSSTPPRVLGTTAMPSDSALTVGWPAQPVSSPAAFLEALVAAKKRAAADNQDLQWVVGEQRALLSVASEFLEAMDEGRDARSQARLAVVAWLATRESGLNAETRWSVLQQLAMSRAVSTGISIDEILEASKEVRLTQIRDAQKFARLRRTPPRWTTLRPEVLLEQVDRLEAEAHGPWTYRTVFAKRSILDWEIADQAGSTIRTLMRVQVRTEGGTRALYEYFASASDDGREPFESTLAWTEASRRWGVSSERLGGFFASLRGLKELSNDYMSGAAMLVRLWRAAIALVGEQPSVDLVLAESGEYVDLITGPKITVRCNSVKGKGPLQRCGTVDPGDWIVHGQASANDEEALRPWWRGFIFTVGTMATEQGRAIDRIAYKDLVLVDDESGRIAVPVDSCGWLIADRIRRRWTNLLSSIQTDEMSDLALRRYLVANALRFVADAWLEPRREQSSRLSFPIENDWFNSFFRFALQTQHPEPFRKWLLALKPSLVDDVAADGWRRGLDLMAGTGGIAPVAAVPNLWGRSLTDGEDKTVLGFANRASRAELIALWRHNDPTDAFLEARSAAGGQFTTLDQLLAISGVGVARGTRLVNHALSQGPK